MIEGRITLAGGDPNNISLRHFLDAGYALLLEDALRVPGVLLEQATEMVDNAFKSATGEPVTESTVPVAAQNTNAMAQLEAMMAQVKR